MKLGIVVAEFNGEITSSMEAAAKKHAASKGIEVAEIIHVPGVYDIPLAVKKLLKKKGIDAVVTLGAVIKGGTGHDEVIAHSTANALALLSLEFEKPVSLGISGPCMNKKQAMERAVPYAKNAVDAAVKMFSVVK
jgi:6,7-dimethyl-8-ribityllumazine synthase